MPMAISAATKPLLLCSPYNYNPLSYSFHRPTMKSAAAILALAASASAFAPAPVSKQSTALNTVWDS